MTLLMSGLMNRRIVIQRATITRNASTGAEVKSWATYATVWAQVLESVTPREATANSGAQGAVAAFGYQTKFRIRHRTDIRRDKMRISYRGQLYRIVAIAEIGSRKEGLQLAAEEWSHE